MAENAALALDLPDLATDAARVTQMALAEDGALDITTETTVASALDVFATVEFRQAGVLAGRAYAEAVARACDCSVEWRYADGARIGAGTVVAAVRGDLRRLLRAERPLLNLLQRASGIATYTCAFVEAVAGTACRVLHTRKTAPGLRGLDVRAVLAGGGGAHRASLGRVFMVKDNHWWALTRQGRALASALDEARRRGVRDCYVEVESAAQTEEACRAEATRIVIDNQPPETVGRWGRLARQLRPGIEVEATGGITLENVRGYAEAGVDAVSVGALTHSALAANLALTVRAVPA